MLQPAYSEKYTQADHKLCAIDIEPIPSIVGTEFYHHLSNLMPRCTPIKYRLTVVLNYQGSPSIIQKNSDISRQNLTQLVHYKLLDLQNQQIVTSGQFYNMSSYNAAATTYINYTEGESMLETMTSKAAEELRTRLILFFS